MDGVKRAVMIGGIILLVFLVWTSGSTPLIIETLQRVLDEFSTLIDNWQGQ